MTHHVITAMQLTAMVSGQKKNTQLLPKSRYCKQTASLCARLLMKWQRNTVAG